MSLPCCSQAAAPCMTEPFQASELQLQAQTGPGPACFAARHPLKFVPLGNTAEGSSWTERPDARSGLMTAREEAVAGQEKQKQQHWGDALQNFSRLCCQNSPELSGQRRFSLQALPFQASKSHGPLCPLGRKDEKERGVLGVRRVGEGEGHTHRTL